MKICPACRHHNREGFLFCEECGQNLRDTAHTILPTRQIHEAANSLYSHVTWGTARFNNDSWVVLHVRDTSAPVVFRPDRQHVLGRIDDSSPTRPDIDLEPYDGLEKGVSRVHAAIMRNENTLVLIDMGSSNGTHLNGQRLLPEQPRVLRDGDEIRLGKLVMHIYFRVSPAL